MSEPPYGIQYGLGGDEPQPPQAGYTIPTYEQGPDPLGGAPGETFEGWAKRVVGICRRSGGPVAGILLVASIVPAIGLLIAYVAMAPRLNTAMTTDLPTTGEPITAHQLADFYTALFGYYGVILAVSTVTAYFTSAGWIAALRLMATDAIGQPRDLAATVRYGLRRGLPLWGWYILASLCVLVGWCFCFVPGLYLALALSMIAPITTFERGAPAFTRSFRVVHANFWPVVGRLIVLFLAVFGYAGVISTLSSLVLRIFTPTSTAAVPELPSIGVMIPLTLITAILTVPAMVVLIAGILAVYAEQRARFEGTTSEQLAASCA